jgi:hypothetical protein
LDFTPDRAKFKDSMGRYITQSLFLEHSYNEELAVYTITDTDKEYNGRVYPSLKKLYMEIADPTEYEFATTCLWGWAHWEQTSANQWVEAHVEKWRAELEMKLRSRAVRDLMAQAKDKTAAAQWVASGKWKEPKRGRPTNEELQAEKNKRLRIVEAADEDSARIYDLVNNKGANNG